MNSDTFSAPSLPSWPSQPSVPPEMPAMPAVTSFPSGIFGQGFPFSEEVDTLDFFDNVFAPEPASVFGSPQAESVNHGRGRTTPSAYSDNTDDASTLRRSPSPASTGTTLGTSHGVVSGDRQPRPYAGVPTSQGLRPIDANAGGDGRAQT
jgi:hypothetical protein